MDFIKRNLGLLAFLLVSLVVAGFLLLGIFRARRDLVARRKEVAADQEWLKNSGDLKIALTPENVDMARKNHEVAQKKLTELRRWLWQKFSIPSQTTTAVECLRMIKSECLAMHQLLKSKDIGLAQSCAYLSFGTKVTDLPGAEEVPVILKQLQVVHEIVRVVSTSYVTQIQDLRRLTDTTILEREDYDLIPFQIVVVGELPRIRLFVNQLQQKARYYFMVRYLSLEAANKTGGLPSLSGSGGGGATGAMGGGGPAGAAMPGMGGGAAGGGPGADMMMAGGGGAGAMGGAGPAGAMMPGMGGGAAGGAGPGVDMMMAGHAAGGPGAPMGPEMMMRGRAAAGAPGGAPGTGGGTATPGRQAAQPAETREDRIVFKQPQLIVATVRFDFVEFHKPEAE